MESVHYQYTYGAGSSFNREIIFEPNSQGYSIDVYALSGEKKDKICSVSSENINVEMTSTSQKAQNMYLQRMGENVGVLSDKKFNELSIQEQQGIVDQLDRNIGKRIEIFNAPGQEFEVVVKLNIFDPR